MSTENVLQRMPGRTGPPKRDEVRWMIRKAERSVPTVERAKHRMRELEQYCVEFSLLPPGALFILWRSGRHFAEK